MAEVKIVERICYDIGPYRDICVWPYIEVGFSDPRFKEPVSFRFLDELPEGKGPTDYSVIPPEVIDQILKMASESPPSFTDEDQELGERYFTILALVAEFLPEEFSHQGLADLLWKAGVVCGLLQLRKITIELARAGFLSREARKRKRGRPLKLKLTQKGLHFVGVKRG